MRIAPAEPFSPFKRRISSESQGRGRRKDGEEEEKRSSSTDPRYTFSAFKLIMFSFEIFPHLNSITCCPLDVCVAQS